MSIESCLNKVPPVLITALPVSKYQMVSRCEKIVNIGLFFDGTGNNRAADMSSNAHSNVARLFDAYKHDPDQGFFRYYIEGIGTKCDLVNDPGKTTAGLAFGSGGKARVLLGLLQVLNSLHSFVNRREETKGVPVGVPMFQLTQIQALCSDAPHGSYKLNDNDTPYDQLRKAARLDSGLLACNMVELKHFFSVCAQRIHDQLAKISTRPTVVSIYLDVIGFSRGAAEARVFVNWLNAFMMSRGDADARQLFGVPSYVRFLGLFDTVASVIGGPVGLLMGSGHDDWASMKNLAIPPRPVVQHCVHYVALHELRNSFPVDSIYVDGVAPDNCYERVGPGSHSDIGGGYVPGAQGKGVDSSRQPLQAQDRHKLSQFYLNEMLVQARQSAALCGPESYPWLDERDKEAVQRKIQQQFAFDPRVRQAIERYFALCGIAACSTLEMALREHGLRYLAWRYQLLKERSFKDLPSVAHAAHTDPKGVKYYRMSQDLFAKQVMCVEVRVGSYYREAPAMLKRMKRMTTTLELGMFFDWWIHDSYAVFLQAFEGETLMFSMAEPHGYIRYRVLFLGTDERGREVRRNAALSPADSALVARSA